MTEYRIVELHRRFHIEERINGKEWHDVRFENVPRYFDSLADARSWVATIKRGVVYHDAEDAPNLAQDERKVEDDTSNGTKPLEWFIERVGKNVIWYDGDKFLAEIIIFSKDYANKCFLFQREHGNRYRDAP